MSSSHAVVMQETSTADNSGMSQHVNTTTFGGLPMHIQLSDTLTSPNVAESAAILFSMSQGATTNAMFAQNIGDVIRFPITCVKTEKDSLPNGPLVQALKEESTEVTEKTVGHPLTIGVPVSFPDPGQPSPSASSTHSGSQVLRFRASGNAGDAMLSAINYNESEVLQEDPFNVGVNNNLSNLDDGILVGVGSAGNNPGSAFDLFDGEGNVNESYNMDTLSPHPFPDSGNNFSISDGSLNISDSDSLSSKVDGRSLDSTNQGLSKSKSKNRLPKAALSPGRLGIQCTLCPKAFNNSSALAKHKLTHSDERKYICNVCSKAFKRQDHLNGHLMTHREKKPYECHFDNCEKSYCDARSLKRHLENHHQQSPEAIHAALTIIAQTVAAQGGTVPKSLTLAALPHTSSDSSTSNRITYQQTQTQNNTVAQSVGYNATPYNSGGTPVSSPTYSNPPPQPHLFQFDQAQLQQKQQLPQVQQQVVVKHKTSQQSAVQQSQPQPPSCPQPKPQSQLPPPKPQPQPQPQPIKTEHTVSTQVTQPTTTAPLETKPDPPQIVKATTTSWHPDQQPVFTINQFQINAQAAQVNINNRDGPSPTYVQQVSPVTPIPPVIQSHTNAISNPPPITAPQQNVWFNSRPTHPPKPRSSKKAAAAEATVSNDDNDGTPKPKCNICDRRFKSIPALNGHMRLHGGYFKKDEEGKKHKKSTVPAAIQNTSSLPHTKPASSTHLVSFAGNSSLPSISRAFQVPVDKSNSTPQSPIEAPAQILQLHSQHIEGGQPVQAVQIIQNVQLLPSDVHQNVSQDGQLQELTAQQKLLQHVSQDQQEQLNQQAQITILEQLQQQQQNIHALHEQIQLQVQQLQQQQQQLQQNSLQQIQNADPAFQQQLQQQLQEQIQQQQQVQEQQIQQLQQQLQQQIEVHIQQQQQLQQVQQLQTTQVSEQLQLQAVSEQDVIQLTQSHPEQTNVQAPPSSSTTAQIQSVTTTSERVITSEDKKNISNLDFLLAYQDQFIKDNLREANPSVSDSTSFHLQQPSQQIVQTASNVAPFGPPLNVEVPPNEVNAHNQPLNLRTPPISLSSEAIQTSLQSVLAQMQLPQLSIQEVDNNVGNTNENFDTDSNSIQPSKHIPDNNELTVSQLFDSMVQYDDRATDSTNQLSKLSEQPSQRIDEQQIGYNSYSTDDILSLLQSKSSSQKSDISVSNSLSSHFSSNSAHNTLSSADHPGFISASSNIRKQLHQQIVSRDSVMAASSSSFQSSPVLGGSSNTFNINSLCDSAQIPGQFKPIKPDPTVRKRRYSCDTDRTSPIKRSTTAPSNLIMLLNKGVSSGTLNKSGSNPSVEGKQRIRMRSKSGDSHGLLRSKSIEHTFMRPRSQTSEIFARPRDWLDSGIFSKSDGAGTFRNPNVLPGSFKFKRKHRPAPLYIPPHTNNCGFPSRLRSPRIFEAGERKLGTPPPYTPPPMLSPMRSGSGLFWTLKPLTPKSAPITPRGLLSAQRRSSLGGISIAPEEEEEDITEPLVEEEEPPPETDILPHVNVGPMYQARLPVFSSNKSHALNSLSKESLVWDPKLITDRSEEDVQCFQEFACSSAIKGGGCNIEYALHLLNIAKGNICKAMLLLMNAQPKLPKNHTLSSYEYQEKESWTTTEIEAFQQALHKYDKDFFRISKEVNTKCTRKCVLFYYLWKKACPEEYKRLRIIRRKRENEELYNLRSTNQNQTEPPPQPQDLDESDSESSFERSDDHIDKDEEPDRPSSVPPPVAITYPCSYPACTASFSSKQALNAHGRIHSGPKSHDVSRSPARGHNANPSPVLDNGISDTVFPCKVCGRVFTKVKSRSAHMKIHRVDDSEKKQAKLDILHAVSPERF